ncbi:hypothetical protein L218DRAFT_945735 [Marasmius fiardii PR-910]|nr:hypothetical protein L218DRAFT_945735 [Marasmius fiardii PR-910]
MEVLANATKVNINNSHFSNVGKNQYNNCTFHCPIAWPPEKRNKVLNLQQLSETFKWGDIYKDLNGSCYSWQLCSNRKDGTEAAVYHAKINIAGSFGQKRFTVKTYCGQNVLKVLINEALPNLVNALVPELIPITHLQVKAGMTMNIVQLYFEALGDTLGCSMNEIWMDPVNGKFCRGPAGPRYWDWLGYLSGITIPADVDFLKEVNHPQVTSKVDDLTIAFKWNVGWMPVRGCLKKKKVTQHGLMRYHLKDSQCHLTVQSRNPAHPWPAQALSIFHTHSIRLDEDLSIYKLVYPVFKLKGVLKGVLKDLNPNNSGANYAN